MSDSNKSLIPNQLVDLLVSDIFQKNGIKPETVQGKVSDEQKQMLKELLQNLTQQVEAFVNNPEKNQ
ncbi:MAG: spore coat protein [Bacillota bacterium]|nr:spore coat protein [Bacillota bacterium]